MSHPSTTQMSSIYELLSQVASEHADKTALTYITAVEPLQDVAISYQALWQGVNRAGRLFRESCGGRRGVVSILLPNIPQNHIALWGAESVGIANPLNPLLSVDALASLMAKAETDVIVALGPNPVSDIWQKAEAVAARLAENGGRAPRLIAVGGENDGAPIEQFDALLAQQSGEALPSEWMPAGGDIAAYFHTGGTTGTPKLAMHSHANQLCTAQAYIDTMGCEPGDVGINGLPMFHVAGAMVNGLGGIATAMNMVLPTALGFRDPQVIARHWSLVEYYGVAISGGIPTSVAAMVGTPVADADIRCLRFMIGGGAPVPASLYADVERVAGVPLYSIYGMTECAGVIAMPNLQHSTVPGSAGHIQAPLEVRIDGAKQAGDCGEICVRGPMVFPGYLGHNSNPLDDGWLRTGDLGYLDAGNNLFITGRAKDLIIRSGHNIDPAMIEHCLEDHPAVALAAAVGWPDDYAGELPVAFVQLHPGQSVASDALMSYAQENIDERPACPKRIIQLDALPVTAVGKIHKPSLRQMTAEGAVREALTAQGYTDVKVSGRVLASGGVEVLVADMDGNAALADACQQLADSLGLVVTLEAAACS